MNEKQYKEYLNRQKYQNKVYARISLLIRQDQKELLQKYCSGNGITVNSYINKLLSEHIDGFIPLSYTNSKAYKPGTKQDTKQNTQ